MDSSTIPDTTGTSPRLSIRTDTDQGKLWSVNTTRSPDTETVALETSIVTGYVKCHPARKLGVI